MVLTEGWDSPIASCAVLARPTKSKGLYLQMAGRILRPYPRKTDTIIIDHSGAVYEHGEIDEFVDWSLDPDTTIQERQKKHAAKRKSLVTCQECKAVYSGKQACPDCGHVNIRFGRGVETAAGQLVEVDEAITKEEKHARQREYERQFYSELVAYCQAKGWNAGWSKHKYRAKFGKWPRFKDAIVPAPAGAEVLAFIRNEQARYYREQNKKPEAKA